jgi:hypothetical protein
MEDPKTEARALGGALLVAGAWLVAAALRGDPNALWFQAGMDGAIVAVVVATLLALAHGLRYRTAIALVAPIMAVQALVVRGAGFPVVPAMGLELSILGALGLASATLQRQVSSKKPPARTLRSPSKSPPRATAIPSS